MTYIQEFHLQGSSNRARRAILYMPGDDMRKIQKGSLLGVDCICMDIEDGVAHNRKTEARSTILEALHSVDFGSTERLVRINRIGSKLEAQDLSTILPAMPDGIVIPKVETAGQVHWVSDRIKKLEEAQDLTPGKIGLLAIVETARGILNLAKIAGADPRLQALIFGAEDFAGDIGATRTQEGSEVLYARSAVLTHAAAFNLQAIDMVYIDYRDQTGLHNEAQGGAMMGFAGKQVIHPDQVAIVQAAFTPRDEAIAQARSIIHEYEHQQGAGKGAFAIDGKLVDAPTIRQAYSLLARARAAGKLNQTVS